MIADIMMLRVIAAGSLSLIISGCSSVMTHSGASQGYYPGTRTSVSMLSDKNTSWAMMPLLAVDVPFSATLDTLLLPYDYMRSNRNSTLDSPLARVQQHENSAIKSSSTAASATTLPPTASTSTVPTSSNGTTP